MAWFGSISWAPACPKWRMTGEGCGSWPSCISRSRCCRRFWSNEGGQMVRAKRRAIIVLGLLLIAAGAAGYLVWRPEPAAQLTGVVRATEIRVAPEVGGQLAAIKVHKGDRVRGGDVVAELSALELSAAVVQARAALAAAQANRDHVYAGVRAEETAALAAEIAKAKSRLAYAEQQLARTAYLARDRKSTRLNSSH